MDLTNQMLSTLRLRLRPWRREDLDVMANWPPFTEPLDQIWNWPQRLRAEGSLDLFFFSHASDPARAAWTILLDDAAVGLLQLKQIRPAEGNAEFGIAFGSSWVGQAYGYEALKAFFGFYFGPAGFRVLRLEVAPANLRAHRLYTRLGFEETARFWRFAGSASEYAFLDRVGYAEVRPYFRQTGSGVYQLYVEMRLDALGWQRSEPFAELQDD
jgi:RimJ/RimL family protein N-acetyltransferase